MADIKLVNGFENAVMVDNEPDRVYNASDVNTRFEGLVSSYGVYSNIGSGCQVTASTGLKLIVKKGKGEVNSHYFKIESDTEITLSKADVILNRIDSIVVRRTSADREIVLAIKEGTLATNPVAPTITRTEAVQEICLANVYVGKNATSITASNITDTRPDTSRCGFIACLVDQLDTSELFNQYEDAQNNFINNQTTNFNNWFEGIKDEVRATNLYREYQAVYRSNTAGQKEITIPTSINYVHNGLDVLNVFINGMRLLKDVEYTIDTTGTKITLTTALDVATQDVEFVNKKSIEGTIAESTVLRVEALEDDVSNLLEYDYQANGSTDADILNNKVLSFLERTGSYSAVGDNANLRIKVHGTLGLSYPDVSPYDTAVFRFQTEVSSNRKVYIDFSDATIPYSTETTKTSYAIFLLGDNVYIENANIRIDNITATTLYAFHGGHVRDCNIIGTNRCTTFYGAWGCEEFSNSNIDISLPQNAYGAYGCRNVLFNKIVMAPTSINISMRSCHRCIGNDYNGSIETTEFNIANTDISE